MPQSNTNTAALGYKIGQFASISATVYSTTAPKVLLLKTAFGLLYFVHAGNVEID